MTGENAVAALHAGLRVRRVVLERRNGQVSGRCDVKSCDWYSSSRDRWLVVAIAGQAAVSYLNGDPRTGKLPPGDHQKAVRLSRVPGNRVRTAIRQSAARVEAEVIVEEHWPAIRTIARELLRLGVLTVREVKRLAGGVA